MRHFNQQRGTFAVKQVLKKHPFLCNIHTHTQISPLAPHPKPLGAHFLIIQAFLSFLSGRKQWMASRALCVCFLICVGTCAVCMYLYVRVCVCLAHKVKQPLNKFESVTHWGLPSPSISADRMACLSSMHAAHCGL